ncbi:MAG TPA: DUF6702 family protein [Gemmatimonadaceae bacterium]|nr:DUF6702 family protein [Gemmatimonadaceae bacterium]
MIGLLLTLALSLAAHPLHTTVLELRWETNARSLEGTLRVFEDDLLAASTDAGVTASAYVLRHLRIGVAGQIVDVTTCGERRAADAVLVCLKAIVPVSGQRPVTVRNSVLMDRHADQVNIVRLRGTCSTTFLLTSGSPEQVAGECR